MEERGKLGKSHAIPRQECEGGGEGSGGHVCDLVMKMGKRGSLTNYMKC